jgi:predicted MFS family arabinose efflux permease
MSDSSRGLVASAYVAFAAFGAFWGVWGASVPHVQDQAGVSDGELGLALLFVGAGALPAMLLVGRALDRWGLQVAAGVISLLGVVGACLALTAKDLTSLCAGLAVSGAASGAADVAMNSVAGRAETLAGKPVITRVHGTFSAFVVLASLGAGASAAAGWALAVPFVVVAALSIAAGVAMLRTLPPRAAPQEHTAATQAGRSRLKPLTLLVAALGLVVAGAGTAVLFPTLLGIVSRNVEESRRGRATSVVTVVSYLGFLLGPVYVGLWADATDLRGAMIAVAALAGALFILTPMLLRLSGFAR